MKEPVSDGDGCDDGTGFVSGDECRWAYAWVGRIGRIRA